MVRGPLWVALGDQVRRPGQGRGPAFGLCGLDLVPGAVARPSMSAGSLNVDVFRKVNKLLSAKNSKHEGLIGWA